MLIIPATINGKSAGRIAHPFGLAPSTGIIGRLWPGVGVMVA